MESTHVTEITTFSFSFTQSELNVEETLLNVDDVQNYISHTFSDDTDSSSDNTENSSLKLSLGLTFHTWDEAEKYLNDYALGKGFSIRRRRTESTNDVDNDKVLRKISWECGCAGNYQPKKILNPNEQRNRQSKATGCKWRVNGNLPKTSSIISFTTVVDEHNHLMIPLPSIT